MIGHIESYDDERQTGAIKFKDKFYEFHIDDWNLDAMPLVGDDVDFMPEDDGSATNIGPVGAYLAGADLTPVKNHYIAAVLGLLLGAIGAHRIYLGFYKIAFFQVALTVATLGFGVIWGFIEGFLLLTGNMNKDAKGRSLK